MGVAAAGALASCGADPPGKSAANPARAEPSTGGSRRAAGPRPDADDAWRRLVAGNERFADGQATHPRQAAARRRSLVGQQRPIACVLGCVDSRVPPELVFDQGLGDLLIARTAGQVLDEAVIGSAEYGVAHLGVPLVVVLGHANCGAVTAAVEAVRGDVAAVVQAIEPAVRATRVDDDPKVYLAACVAEQARRVATGLVERSALISDAVEREQTTVVAAMYDLRSGRVRRLT
ncbi:MAG: carbonic anhydrase [Micromonosporaceae bacterium]|nr:carbonic anhydrase [Micromonosporaceae bacterium]